MNAIVPRHPPAPTPGPLRVYVDATVVRSCFEGDFRTPSRQLFDGFAWGALTMLLSDRVVTDLDEAPLEVRSALSRVPEAHFELLATTTNARELVDAYVRVGAVAESSRHHAWHFALATLAQADVLVSWDFKNVVNLYRIQFCNYVNVARGLERLAVQTPQALDLPATSDSSESESFSYVKLMREVRDTINREYQQMTPEEHAQWRDPRVHTDPILRRLARRMAGTNPPASKPQHSCGRDG